MSLTTTINYNETESFKRDFKSLKKKFKTLDEDFQIAKTNAIELFHVHSLDNQSLELIPGLGNEKYKIYKLRKFACKSLKGKGVRSGIRMIYGFCLETSSIFFIEAYFKADKENEDKERIKSFLKTQQDSAPKV